VTAHTLVALLYEPSPVFDYDPSLWAILEDGAFLGRASADDRKATFPALEPDQQSTFSFEELERPSGEPIRVTYDANSGEVERHPEPGLGDVPASGAAGTPEDWAGAFNFAPLPDLLGDGKMHAVDLRAASNIDAFYLVPAQRVRCLSELGWAAFRQRIGLSSMRIINHLDDLRNVGVDVWREVELWERWNRSGRKPAAFQAWLDQPEGNLGGFTRRSLLYRGVTSEILAVLERELSSSRSSAAKKAGVVKKAARKSLPAKKTGE
jgi:hypothetical protein